MVLIFTPIIAEVIIINRIGTKLISNKNFKLLSFFKDFIEFVNLRLEYGRMQQEELITKFGIIINEEFLNILTSLHKPLEDGYEGENDDWCWLRLVTESLIFLVTSPKLYLHMFIEYYLYNLNSFNHP